MEQDFALYFGSLIIPAKGAGDTAFRKLLIIFPAQVLRPHISMGEFVLKVSSVEVQVLDLWGGSDFELW